MRNPRLLALLAGPLLAALVAFMDTPAGLTLAGQRSLAVLALCVVWWVFTPVGLPVTSIMGLALLPLLGAMPAAEAFALFGNQAVFFVIGVFLVAAVMLETGLSSRISLICLRKFARDENRLCNGVLFVSWGLCAVVVSHAVAALMLPIVLELLRALSLGPRSNTAKRLLLSMAWGTVAGSNLTLLSSARATLSLELYGTYLNKYDLPADPIGFLEYSLGSAPVSLASVFIAALVLRWVFPPEGLDLAPAVKQLDERVKAMGSISRRELSTLAVIATMIVCVVSFGREYGMGTVALLFSAILFSLQTLKWEDAERYVNWGVALMYGGAIAIGSALHSTGATTWLIGVLMPASDISPWATLAGTAVATAGMTELVSNSAVIALVMPVILPVADQVSMDPRVFAWAAPISAGLAFVLPTSTPALAMVFGTGHLRIRHAMPGLIITFFSLLAFLLAARFVWPLIGLPVTP